MDNTVKKIPCNSCLHSEVCIYKQDIRDVSDAVYAATVNRPCEDGKKVSLVPITNFECLWSIEVNCKYHELGKPKGIFNDI